VRSLKKQLNEKLLRLAEVEKAASMSKRIVSAEEVRSELADMTGMLEAASTGEPGGDAVYTAATILRQLVGGCITVSFTARPGRKRTVAKATFVPEVLKVAKKRLGILGSEGSRENSEQVTVWLREPPRVDRIADEVRRLYEIEHLGFREIGIRLECGSGNACLAYRRSYEMRGLPVPPARGRAGRPRKKR
jgi:hypothetical protein